jgi:hypothetical protein
MNERRNVTTMKKIISIAGIALISLLRAVQPCHADVEWTLQKQLSLEGNPLDVALSSDGQWIYVLVPGEVQVYSASEDRIVTRIPVDRSFDRLAHSATDSTLIVTSSSGKVARLIHLEAVRTFDLADLPFKGPEKAPVVIAVFSDYQ